MGSKPMNTSNTKMFNAIDHPDMFAPPEETQEEPEALIYDVDRRGKSKAQKAANKRERRNKRDGRRQRRGQK